MRKTTIKSGYFATLAAIIMMFFLNSLAVFGKGYQIKVKINGVKDTTLILAHYFGKSIYPDDTIKVNKSGEGVFKGTDLLPGGMYVIFLPSQSYFDFFIDEDQEFTIYNDTADFLKNFVVEGCVINEQFIVYQKYIQEKREEREKLEANRDTSDKKNMEAIDEKVEALTKDVEDYTKKIIETNKANFLGIFLNSLQRLNVPDPPKDEQGNIIDSLFQYYYYRNHFFDNFDYTDSRLLRTPLYENKIKNYIDAVIPQFPDSINVELAKMLDKSKKDKEVYRYLLVTLFNHYAQSKIMGMDAVYIFLGENYYLKDAYWSDSTFLKKLNTNIEENKPTLIGKIAPDIELIWVPDDIFKQSATDTAMLNNVHVGYRTFLHQIQAEYIILIFWEKDCGHCRKTVPELYKLYQDKQLEGKGVKIVSFHMLFGKEGKVKWTEFINENKLYGWLNVWNPYSYRFKELYNIKSTPVILVLDKDKKIVAKRIGADQAIDIIESMIKRDLNKKK